MKVWAVFFEKISFVIIIRPNIEELDLYIKKVYGTTEYCYIELNQSVDLDKKLREDG